MTMNLPQEIYHNTQTNQPMSQMDYKPSVNQAQMEERENDATTLTCGRAGFGLSGLEYAPLIGTVGC